jgi:hypothetical protein
LSRTGLQTILIFLVYLLNISALKLTIPQNYVLEALAIFQYLTSQQISTILPNVSISTVNRYLRALRKADKPLVRVLQFGFVPWKWPLAPVYCLTERWAKWLAAQWTYSLNNIKRPLGRSCFFAADYYHRLATIDFKISLIKWISRQWYTLNFYHCYFEREWSNNTLSGATSQSKALLKAWDLQIIPDAIVGYQTPQWSKLILFEQHMGNDAKRALKQIQWHCFFLSLWVVNKKYGSQRNSCIYYVFENKSCMDAVIRRLEQVSGFAKFRPHFRFKTIAQSLSVLVGS